MEMTNKSLCRTKSDFNILLYLFNSAECAFEENGADYCGTAKTSNTGSACLPWKDFHSHHLLADAMLNHKLEFNFCRNPNNESKPWCFVGSKHRPR